jgi:hypothetical protein
MFQGCVAEVADNYRRPLKICTLGEVLPPLGISTSVVHFHFDDGVPNSARGKSRDGQKGARASTAPEELMAFGKLIGNPSHYTAFNP